MSRRRNVTAGLAWLGGANNDILDKVPTERGRFVQMALVLLTTAGIGTLSMMFALNDGVRTPLPVAIIGGITWGFVILNIDRFLVLSMGHTRNWKKLLLMALPRLALAAVISIVVATPMTLRIFQHDIDNQMMLQQTAESAQQSTAEQTGILAKQLAGVNAQIAKWNNVLAGNLEGITASTPQLADDKSTVASLTPQVNAALATTNTAYDKWNCEVNGAGTGCAAGTSTVPGSGPRAQNDYRAYTQDKAISDNLSSQLAAAQQQEATDQQAAEANAKSSLAAQQVIARAQLPGLLKQQATLQHEVNQENQDNASAVAGNDGILAQLQALSSAGTRDPVLAVAQWVVTLLFFFIEILPVMVKFLLSIGPLSLYELMLKNEEDSITDVMKTTRVTKRQDVEREALKQQAIDEDMRQREEALGKMANAHVAAHMENILKQALTNWSMQVQSQLGGQAPPGGPGTGHPAAPTRVTGPLRRLGLTGPQPSVNTWPQAGNGAGYGDGSGYGSSTPNGNGVSADDGYGPTVAYPSPPGAATGFVLPADNDDLL